MKEDYLIKASHGSGWLLDPINTNITECKKKLNEWNKIYSTTEKQYMYIKPRFFIEKKITCKYNGLTGNALDFKVFCFYGIPQYILVRNNKIRNFFTVDWILLKGTQVEKPTYLENIISLAKELSNKFEFVRVDFYIGVDGIYFSEFTFTPMSGRIEFNMETEMKLSKYWN